MHHHPEHQDGRSRSFQVTPMASCLPALQSLAWAWANDAFPAESRHRASQIKDMAARTGHALFKTPQCHASLQDLDELCALALQALGGIAVSKTKGRTPWVFYAVA